MRRFKDLLFENWYLKLFSLILAAGLWALIAQESTSEVFFQVPLEYQNVPPDTEVTGDAARTVEVRLRGPSTLIREITAKDISTVIDLDQMPRDGEKTLPLNPQHVHAPFGVDVLSVTPSSIRVALEPTMTGTLLVLPQTTGRLPQGYEIQTVVNPKSIKAEGPASHIRPLVSVMTTPIDISGRKATFSQTVDLDLQDPLVRFPEAIPIRVEAIIRKKQ